MGRPQKRGLYYFSCDVDFYSDTKLRRLLRAKGNGALSVYHCILCNVYREGYYLEWDDDLSFVIAEQVGLEEEYVYDSICYCMELGLFDKPTFEKYHVITSISIQERYEKIVRESKRKVWMDKYVLLQKEDISSEETRISSEETMVSSEETIENDEKTHISSEESTQIKINKKKINIIPPNTPPEGVKPKKPKEKTLNTKAKEIFEEYYKSTFGNLYYWEAKDAGNMPKLLQKIKFQLGDGASDDDILNGLRNLLSSITDRWIIEHLSVPLLNSKYNEILPKARPKSQHDFSMNVNDYWKNVEFNPADFR